MPSRREFLTTTVAGVGATAFGPRSAAAVPGDSTQAGSNAATAVPAIHIDNVTVVTTIEGADGVVMREQWAGRKSATEPTN